MNVLGLHPEDLFDKLDRGEITDDERVRLDAHLAGCAACRVERKLRADFEFDWETSGQETIRIDALIPVSDLGAARPRTRRLARVRTVVLIAAAAALASGAALAAQSPAARRWLHTLVTGAVSPDQSGPSDRSRDNVVSSAAPSPTHAKMPQVTSVPAAPETAAVPTPSGSSAPPTVASHRAPIPIPVAARSNLASPAFSGDTPEPETSTTLFAAASRARRGGDIAAAIRQYELLQARFPKSPEAVLSVALVARLRLDRGDVTAALRGFDMYLATGDRSLREEAMAGRALCLGRLGQRDAERTAWQILLQAYPATGYRTLAEKRVQENP